MQSRGPDDRSRPERRGAGGEGDAAGGAEDGDRPTDDATVITSLDDLAEKLPGAGAQRHPHLIVIAGVGVGRHYRLAGPVSYIGRGETCEVQIQDTGISRKHARISLEPNGDAIVEDLGSTNGTFVENRRIDRHRLQDGDKIQIGRTAIIKFSVTDATEINFAEQMYTSATQDGLTKVANRKFFDEEFRKEYAYATRHRTPLSVLMIDLDHFKRVNDTYGHSTGDLVLRVVARTLARVVRTEDILARYGGEEFVILARGIDRAGAAILAERIRATVESQLVPNPSGGFRVTVSVGAATMIEGAMRSRVLLLAAADRALYRAKSAGRNRVEQWSESDPIDVSADTVTEDTTA